MHQFTTDFSIATLMTRGMFMSADSNGVSLWLITSNSHGYCGLTTRSSLIPCKSSSSALNESNLGLIWQGKYFKSYNTSYSWPHIDIHSSILRPVLLWVFLSTWVFGAKDKTDTVIRPVWGCPPNSDKEKQPSFNLNPYMTSLERWLNQKDRPAHHARKIE